MSKDLAPIRDDQNITYLLECGEAMLDNFIMQKMASASQHEKAIQVETRAMACDLADAASARVIRELRNSEKKRRGEE